MQKIMTVLYIADLVIALITLTIALYYICIIGSKKYRNEGENEDGKN